MTIEHVRAQSPPVDSQWRTLLTDEQRHMWIHRLANLVLLDRLKNSTSAIYVSCRLTASSFEADRQRQPDYDDADPDCPGG